MDDKTRQEFDEFFKPAPKDTNVIALQPRQAAKNRSKNTIPNGDIIAVVTELGFELKYNEVTLEKEVNGAALNDGMYAKIIGSLRYYGEKKDVKQFQNERVMALAMDEAFNLKSYNPIQDYLERCHEKLRETSINPLKELMDNMEFPSDKEKEWAEIAIEHWIAGSVAKAMNGFQNWMLIIKGPQGKGKSTFCQTLCKNIGTKYFHAGFIDPGNKDHSIKRATAFVWEVDEVTSTTSNADQNKLKAFITQNEIKDRLPYAKYASNYKANANFIGTVNDDAFLKDATGNRRYLVFEINQFNYQYLLSFDPDLLWGYGVHRYNLSKNPSGNIIMEDCYKTMQIDRNEIWRDKSGIELLLEDWIVPAPGCFLYASDIVSQMQGNYKYVNSSTNMLSRQLAEAMKALGYECKLHTVNRRSVYKNCKFSAKIGESPSNKWP